MRIRISMPTDEKLCHVVNEGASLYFLVGGEREFFFSSWCLVWRVDCSLSTWTVHSPLFMQAFCLLVCLFCFVLFCFSTWVGEGQSKESPSSWPVPQNVSTSSTSLLSHMLWQMLSSFHLYRWAEGKNCIFYNRTFYVMSLRNVLLFWGLIKLVHCKRIRIEVGRWLIKLVHCKRIRIEVGRWLI